MPMAKLDDMGRFARDVRWPGVMAAALGPGWTVIEEGLPGRTTVHPDPVSGVHKNGVAVLPAVLESHRPLDCVVLLLGTNDLKARFNVPPVEIAESVDRLVRVVLQSETGPDRAAPALLLVAPPPVIEAGCLVEIFAGAAAKSRRLVAPGYAAVARRRGVGFLDAGTVMRPSPTEGVHFDAEGHAALGRAVSDAVEAMTGKGS
jgi:lysophospholipase L1-like esterase